MTQKVTVEEYLDRLERGIETGGARFGLGVERSEDWEANYSDPEAQERMVTNLREAIKEGKPVKGAKKLGTAGWRAITAEKAGAYTASAKRARANAARKAEVVIAAGEAAKAAAAAVTGFTGRDLVREKLMAAYDARKEVWDKYHAEQAMLEPSVVE